MALEQLIGLAGLWGVGGDTLLYNCHHSATPQVTTGLPASHIVMVITPCWLPDWYAKWLGSSATSSQVFFSTG